LARAAMPPVRVFVNVADAYTTRHIGQFLAQAAIGSASADEDEEDEEEEGAPPKETYEVVGTLSGPGVPKPKWLAEVVPAGDQQLLKQAILSCKYVVVDIGSDRSQLELCRWAVDLMRDGMDEFPRGGKTFVCLSSVMTWAKTRPVDPEGDPTAPILEDEYKRRRAHNKFRAEIELEKHVTQQGRNTKGRFRTFIVCAGLQYGMGENYLHDMFRTAWHLEEPALPVLSPGTQVVPMIHVQDLASVIHCVLEGPPEVRYILALDDSSGTSSLAEVGAAIADRVGTRKTVVAPLSGNPMVVAEPPTVEERLTINVRLEAAAIKEMNVKWRAQAGIAEAIDGVAEEYRTCRNLKPLRVFVHGPPMSGANELAASLAKEYKLNLLSKESLIKDAIAELQSAAAYLERPLNEVGEDGEPIPEDEEAAERAREAKSRLDELEQMKADNKGEYEESQIMDWCKARVLSMTCQNQGYVLVNYPATDEQATAVFAAADEAEDQEAPNPLTVPEFIFALDAPDDVLLERAMALPPTEAPEGSIFSEAGMKEALPAFRKTNDEDREREDDGTTILNWFDFKEIHPTYLDVSEMADADVLKATRVALPSPRNYGPTAEEKAALGRQQADRKANAKAEADRLKAENDAREFAVHEKSELAWKEKADEIKRQEAEALEASSIPLRTFLMKHVMPTLSQGLAEVCRTRPDDPVDALAEYLFKNNPRIE